MWQNGAAFGCAVFAIKKYRSIDAAVSSFGASAKGAIEREPFDLGPLFPRCVLVRKKLKRSYKDGKFRPTRTVVEYRHGDTPLVHTQ